MNNVAWKIVISDGDCAYAYVIDKGSDRVSVAQVAEAVAKKVKGVLKEGQYVENSDFNRIGFN